MLIYLRVSLFCLHSLLCQIAAFVLYSFLLMFLNWLLDNYSIKLILGEFVAKPVGIRLITSRTGISNVTADPHVGISPLYFMHLLPHIPDFNLYNRYITVKL